MRTSQNEGHNAWKIKGGHNPRSRLTVSVRDKSRFDCLQFHDLHTPKRIAERDLGEMAAPSCKQYTQVAAAQRGLAREQARAPEQRRADRMTDRGHEAVSASAALPGYTATYRIDRAISSTRQQNFETPFLLGAPPRARELLPSAGSF